MAVENQISFKVVRPAPEFEQIPNEIICKADALTLGIYVKLIHIAPSWKKISIARIATELGLSIARVRFAITWLEREGYLVRTAIQDKSGKMTGWQYTLFGNRVCEDERSNAGYATNSTVLSKNRQDGKPTRRKTDKSENDNGGENITDNSLSNGSNDIIYKNISIKEEKIDKEEKTYRKEEKEQKESLGHIVTDERYLPAMSEWLEYKRERRQTYKPRGLKACYSRLVALSNGDPQVALEKVVRFSISNNYTGLFRENEKAVAQAQKKNMSEQFLNVNERFNMDEYEDY